ncbi:unnamed protein product [Caenorhabditis sp. 36 PRJEB53466]|nr:unnamed protein product [Caenorhabditis sp. 36 PRJEB53466]
MQRRGLLVNAMNITIGKKSHEDYYRQAINRIYLFKPFTQSKEALPNDATLKSLEIKALTLPYPVFEAHRWGSQKKVITIETLPDHILSR